MNKEIKDRLKAAGLKPTDLTSSELKQLEKALNLEKQGAMVLDGVLSNPDVYYRRKK